MTGDDASVSRADGGTSSPSTTSLASQEAPSPTSAVTELVSVPSAPVARTTAPDGEPSVTRALEPERLFHPVGETATSRAAHYARASLSARTWQTYEEGWRGFAAWCTDTRRVAFPAEPHTVAEYLAHLADTGRAVSTVDLRLAAIRFVHRALGERASVDDEALSRVMRGIRRERRTPRRPKAAATDALVRRMASAIDTSTLVGARDRALLLTGYEGAFRRSELVGLHVKDVTFTEHGADVTLGVSKTDPGGAGRTVPIRAREHPDWCAVDALETWIARAALVDGPLYRRLRRYGTVTEHALSTQSVADIIKRAAEAVGLDPAQFSGHSLRRGFVTSALRDGTPLPSIQRVTGHGSVETVLLYHDPEATVEPRRLARGRARAARHSVETRTRRRD